MGGLRRLIFIGLWRGRCRYREEVVGCGYGGDSVFS
jgi:hypothetical protein